LDEENNDPRDLRNNEFKKTKTKEKDEQVGKYQPTLLPPKTNIFVT
jgi:hypothetical protein